MTRMFGISRNQNFFWICDEIGANNLWGYFYCEFSHIISLHDQKNLNLLNARFKRKLLEVITQLVTGRPRF